MRVIRVLSGLALGFLTFLAGCSRGVGEILYGVMQPLYGVVIQPQPHDPTVTLDSFSYTPPSPVSPGDTLEATVTTNKPTDAGAITVSFGDPPAFSMYLRDDGVSPDDVARDGVWVGEFPLSDDTPPFDNLTTNAKLSWADGFPGQELEGESLTISEEGE